MDFDAMCVFVAMANGVITLLYGYQGKNLLPPILGSDKASKHPSTSNNAAATWLPRTANMSPGANRVQVPLFADTHFNDTNTTAY